VGLDDGVRAVFKQEHEQFRRQLRIAQRADDRISDTDFKLDEIIDPYVAIIAYLEVKFGQGTTNINDYLSDIQRSTTAIEKEDLSTERTLKLTARYLATDRADEAYVEARDNYDETALMHEYQARPADSPGDWTTITLQDTLGEEHNIDYTQINALLKFLKADETNAEIITDVITAATKAYDDEQREGASLMDAYIRINGGGQTGRYLQLLDTANAEPCEAPPETVPDVPQAIGDA